MGIFSKKSKDTARAMFYDGELQGFTANTPCTFRVEITDLIISRINPVVQAALPLENASRRRKSCRRQIICGCIRAWTRRRSNCPA